MTQSIKQNGVTLMNSPENTSCSIIFNNLTGINLKGQDYKQYVNTMFCEFPSLTYGEIELWDDNECKRKGNVKH